jgi:serine/threonine-protein kinase
MVGSDLSFRSVKITDFGIAKLAQSQIDSEALRMNETNQTDGLTSTMLGAIPFLAPEVLRKGKPGVGPAGFGSDVWSLGAMGYWLLSGKYPFDTGFDAVANILLGKRTPWDPVITSNKMTSELAKSLQRIIETCLVLDPVARPSAEALAEHLGRLGYFTGKRECGVVKSPGQYGGVWKGMSESGQPIMLHNDEVMAGGQVKVGSRISYIACPGYPNPRAFSIIKLKEI